MHTYGLDAQQLLVGFLAAVCVQVLKTYVGSYRFGRNYIIKLQGLGRGLQGSPV